MGGIRQGRRAAIVVLAALTLGGAPVGALQPTTAFAASKPKPVAPAPKAAPKKPASPPARPQVSASYGRLPLSFEPNRGQADPAVDFLAHGSGYTLYLSHGLAVLSLTMATTATLKDQAPASHLAATLRLTMVGANSFPTVTGSDPLPGKVNYLIGRDPRRWKIGLPTYARITYHNIYPGIDLEYYGVRGQLEYDFIVHPGADPSQINLSLQGADSLQVDAGGELVLKVGRLTIRQQKPALYQLRKGTRAPVTGGFVSGPAHTLTFQVGPHDRTQPLIIDPVLLYSAFLGGTGNDDAQAVAVDGARSAYLTGFTSSTDFPTTAGAAQGGSPTPPSATSPIQHVFVSKVNPAGTALVYSTYIGGSATDVSRGIAVDGAGNAYLAGYTSSTNFPTTTGAFQSTYPGSSQAAFVAELSASGGALVYSTYLGKDGGASTGTAIAIDSSRNAYVTGYTAATNFPTTAGAYQTAFGTATAEAFVTKLDPSGASEVFSTLLGSGNTGANGIAVDSTGTPYVTGSTDSATFPTTPSAFQNTHGTGQTSAFVTRLSASGISLLYSSYLGGNSLDSGLAIAVDGSGKAYLTGLAQSTNFPVTANAYQAAIATSPTPCPTNGSCAAPADAFVTKVDPAASGAASLVYSTYLGGTGTDYGQAIAVDGAGHAFVTGSTNADFPTTASALQRIPAGGIDAFVTELFADGRSLVYSTLLGGAGTDQGRGIALDPFPAIGGWNEALIDQGAYVAGVSNSVSFATVSSSRLGVGGGNDAFLVKIARPRPDPRGGYAIAYDANRDVTVLFGGFNTGVFYNDTWEFDGHSSSWTQRFFEVRPAQRYNSAMVYSPSERRIVLYGGLVPCGSEFGTCTAGDTWEYDGTGWFQKSPAVVPPYRSAFGMANDTRRSRVVVFGGQGINGLLNDTWEWDGANWARTLQGSLPISTAGNCTSGVLPDPRAYFSLAYDANRARTVLFSGTTGSCDFSDTWEYDGTAWTNVSKMAQPGPRGNYAIAFDSARNRTVLMGGCIGGQAPLSDTWEWDGFSWVDQTTAYGTPGGRFNLSAAYDSARQKTVVFAGTNQAPCPPSSSTSLNDTWELTAVSRSGAGGGLPPSVAANLTLTVDEPTIPAGTAAVPLGSIPATRIPGIVDAPAFGPVGNIPIGNTPIGNTPIGNTPIGNTPIGNTPIGNTPIGNTDLSASPIGNTPIGNTPIGNTPTTNLGLDTAFNGGNPLNNVLLSALPLVNWTQILSGTPYAGLPLQTITLQQVFADPTAGPRFDVLTLNQTGLTGSLLRGTHLISVLLGQTRLSSLPVPDGLASWCAEFLAKNPTYPVCQAGAAGINAGTTTLLGADVAGAPLTGVPVAQLPIGAIAGGIAGTPIGNTPIGNTPIGNTSFTFNINATPLGGILIRNLPNPALFVNCSPPVDCSPASTQTLGYASTLNPTAILSTAKLSDLGALLNGITLGELIPGLLPIADFNWEKLAYDGMQDFAPVTPAGAHYHVNFDLACSSTPPVLAIQSTLPPGFRYLPGSTGYAFGSGSAVSGADPAGLPVPLTDAPSTLQWSAFPPDPCFGQTSGSQHVALNFQAQPGLDLGTFAASVTVMTPGQLTSTNQAPITVTENFEPANSSPATAPVIQKDQLIIGHIAGTGDIAYYRLPVPAPGTRVSAFLSHIAPGADFDLVIGESGGKSLIASPIGNTPIGNTPIEDRGAATDNSSTVLTPETLQDIPIGNTPIGNTPIGNTPIAGSVSQNRGNLDEAAQVVTASETGYYTIEVVGYNGSASNRPYMLRVKETPPIQLPPCPARTFQSTGGTVGTLVSPSKVPAGTKTLFLVNQSRMANLYDQASVNQMLTGLGTVAGRSDVKGTVLPVDGDSGVAAAYVAWDQHPCDVNAANSVVRAINVLVAKYRAVQPGLRYVVMVGSDEALPMARVPDLTAYSNESNEARDLAFLTRGGTQAGALYAAEALGYVLTDDAYVAFTSTPYLGHELYLPTISPGRLVETPQEITGQLTQYVNADGRVNPTTALTSGYDFLTDGAQSINNSLNGAGFATIKDSITGLPPLINDAWNKANLVSQFSGAQPVPGINAINGHYNQYQIEPAAANAAGSFTSSDLLSTGDLVPGSMAGRILFTLGCHGGASIPDTLLPSSTPDESTRSLDWAQAYSRQRVAIYVANTGYGYGDTVGVGLSERLMALFAQQFQTDTNNAFSMGERLVLAKHNYFDTMGSYGVYDEKALTEATLYGLPMYHNIGVVGTPPSTLPPLPPVDSTSGLPTQNVATTPTLTRKDTTNGTYWAAGANGDQTQVTFYRPIQPRVDQDVTVQGAAAHGVIIKALMTGDTQGIRPAIAVPTIDSSTHEPPPNYLNDLFPANIVHLDHSNTFGQDRQRFVLIAGQFRPDLAPGLSGTERLVQGTSEDVIYSTSSNFVPPLISQVVAIRDANGITFTVRAGDSLAGVKRVSVLYHQGGQNTWSYQELVAVAGTDQWTATVPGTQDVEVLAQAQDTVGNVGYSTNKGFLFQSILAALDTTAPTTTAVAGPGSPQPPNTSVTVNISSATITPTGGSTQAFGPLTCWNSSSTVVRLIAFDDPGGLGVKQITYSLAGAQSQAPTNVPGSTAAVPISAQGSTTITYFATDFAGNIETPAKSLTVFVNGNAGFACSPAANLTIPAHGTITVAGNVVVTDLRTGSSSTTPFNVSFSF